MVPAWRRGELALLGALVGMLLAGSGAFNLVEESVDHQPFGVHHVRGHLSAPRGSDLGFLTFGLAPLGTGLALGRARQAG
jgi:uncharacterized membrane protein